MTATRFGWRRPAQRTLAASRPEPPPSSRGVTRPSTRFGPSRCRAVRIWLRLIVKSAPSAITTSFGSRSSARRRRTRSSPSSKPRQPRAFATKPRFARSSRASSITESPIASGGRPFTRFWLGLGAYCCVPPQPALASAGAHSSATPTSASVTFPLFRATPWVLCRILFPTVQFAIFFPVVLALSWLLMPRQHWWKPFIVFASYVFYAYASPLFCLLLGGVTLGNQLAAQLIHRAGTERRRTWIVRIAVALDLLMLGVFKYYAFFVGDVDRLL